MLLVELKIQEGLRVLPRLALIAFAARCARRVQPLFLEAWPDAPDGLVEGVARAVCFVERVAVFDELNSFVRPLARSLGRWADLAAHHASFAPERVASSGAYYCAHAAANATGVVAHPQEAVQAAYYAALDAEQALESVLGHDAIPISHDLARLLWAQLTERRTHDTRVAPEFFEPLAVWRSEDELAKRAAYYEWNRAGRPQLSQPEQERTYFAALERIRRERSRPPVP